MSSTELGLLLLALLFIVLLLILLWFGTDDPDNWTK